MTHYTATAAREGRWWMVRIPEVDGLTQARRLGDAGTAAREFIAAALDVPLDDVEVTVRVAEVNGVDVDAAVHEISNARYRASVLEREASEAAVTLAKRLAAAEIPMRDIGAIMGVSHQRAAQLASA